VPVLLVAVVPWLMISDRSFWIDELVSVRTAIQPTLPAMWHLLGRIAESDVQMPLFMAWGWAVDKIVGAGEWKLRAGNIVFVYACAISFARLGRQWRIPGLWLLALVHPFIWYYADEFRPYAMQTGFASLLLPLCLPDPSAYENRAKAIAAMALLTVLTFATSLMALFALVPIVLMWGAVRRISRTWTLRSILFGYAVFICANLPLAVYYGKMFMQGKGRTGLWVPGLGNAAFAIYEFVGLSGLGPERLALREMWRSGSGAMQTFMPYVSGILIAGAVYLAWLVLAARALSLRGSDGPEAARRGTLRRAGLACLGVWALALALMAIGSIVIRFPFYGRHLAPVLPFFLAGMCFLLAAAPAPRLRTAVFVSILLVCLSSSAMVRLAPRHRKDDYRRAARIYRDAAQQGKRVYWAACPDGAAYYLAGPGTDRPRELAEIPMAVRNKLTHGSRQAADEILSCQPEVVILSRPDVYDPSGKVRQYVRDRGLSAALRFPGFEVYGAASQQGAADEF